MYINNNRNSMNAAPRGTLGLATGMDSESVIDGMLQPTRLKIDKQLGLKQQIQWKQDQYRSFITKLNGLQQKYLSFQSPATNLLSSSFYSRKQVTSSSSKVSATANQFAPSSIMIDRVTQLAQPTVLKGNQNITQDIRLAINESSLSAQNEISVTLDGVTKKINFSGGNHDSVISQLNSQLSNAFGSAVSIGLDGTIQANNHRQVTLSGQASVLTGLGLTGTTSNFIRMDATLGSIKTQQPLLGEAHTITINGVDVSFKASDTVSTVLNAINRSDAGVTASYSTITDSFELTSKVSGLGVGISISDKVGNFTQSMFNMGSTSSVQSKRIVMTSPLPSNVGTDPIDYTVPFEIMVDGVNQSFTIPTLPEGETYDLEKAVTALNTLLSQRSTTSDIQLSVAGVDQLSLTSPTKLVSFNAGSGLQAQLGFELQTNEIQDATPLDNISLTGQLTVNGVVSTFDSSSTVADLKAFLQANDVTLNITNHSFELSSISATSLSGDMVSSLFGVSTVSLNQSIGTATVIDGRNAILSVNGTTIERNSNTFEVNGYRLNLNALSDEAITITSKNNVDETITTIKAFIGEYNEFIDEIYRVTQEKTEFRDYPPLTEAQKGEMSENEIKIWEEKAKTGLLRSDRTLTSIVSSLRQIMFNRPDGSSISLADIGITSGNYAARGKLTIDEAKLKSSLEDNNEAVTTLFTQSQSGLAHQIDKVVKDAVQSSSTNPGSLVRLAGMINTSSVIKNQLTEQMTAIDKVIANLNRTYDSQKERYWRQFSRLESVISKMNAQSTWLSQQTGM